MIGKKIVLDDFNFNFGETTTYISVYAAFKYKKNGESYVIYSKDSVNLYYGTYFKQKDEVVVMNGKENPKEIIDLFIKTLLEKKEFNDFEIINLEKVDKIEIIGEYRYSDKIDISKIEDLTIEKIVEKNAVPAKESNRKAIAPIFFILFILIVILFFVMNPEIIKGKNHYYTCTKTYKHTTLPADVNEKISLVFDGKRNVSDIKITYNYVFNDPEFYGEFKKKGYYYKYMKDTDTMKLIDDNYTFRTFSTIDLKSDFFLPKDENGLIEHFKNTEYYCKEEVNQDE